MTRSNTLQMIRIIAGPQTKRARTFRPVALTAFSRTKDDKKRGGRRPNNKTGRRLMAFLTRVRSSTLSAVIHNEGDELGTGRGIKFAEDSVQMGFDGMFTNEKPLGYLLI